MVKTFYQKIAHAELSMIQVVAPGELGKISQEDKIKRKNQLAIELNDLMNFSWENKLYFNDAVGNKIKDLVNHMRILFFNYSMLGEDEWKEKQEQWKILSTEIADEKQILEKDFQKMIGVD